MNHGQLRLEARWAILNGESFGATERSSLSTDGPHGLLPWDQGHMYIFELHREIRTWRKEMTSNTLTSVLKSALRNLAKDTMSVMVKLETKIEEFDGVVSSIVSWFSTTWHTPATSTRKQCSRFSLSAS